MLVRAFQWSAARREQCMGSILLPNPPGIHQADIPYLPGRLILPFANFAVRDPVSRREPPCASLVFTQARNARKHETRQ
jgi:hypothetical protein